MVKNGGKLVLSYDDLECDYLQNMLPDQMPDFSFSLRKKKVLLDYKNENRPSDKQLKELNSCFEPSMGDNEICKEIDTPTKKLCPLPKPKPKAPPGGPTGPKDSQPG